MANSIVQTIRDAEVDARSLSDFISKDPSFTVTRRLAPTIHTLDYYLLVLDRVKDKGDLADIAISNTLDKLEQLEPTVMQRVEDAISNTAIEGGVLTDTFLVATKNGKGMVARSQRDKNIEHLSVKDFGALGTSTANTVADWTVLGSSNYFPDLAAIQAEYPHVVSLDDTIDWVSIQAAINFVSSQGGGVVNIPNGEYLTTYPVELKPFVSLNGIGERVAIAKVTDKTIGTLPNCVMYAESYRQASVENITLSGNRTPYAEGNVVSMDGFVGKGMNYASLRNIRVWHCNTAYSFTNSWVVRMEGTTAGTCQGYGVKLAGANTSFTIINHTNWGTGGGYDIRSSQYTTIISPANDHISYGGLSTDPFLPNGSGGDHKNPGWLFYITGSQVSIISAGMENSACQFLHVEGSAVTLSNPAVVSTVAHSPDYRYIEIINAGNVAVNITGAQRLFQASKADGVTLSYKAAQIFIEHSGLKHGGCKVVTTDVMPTFDAARFPAPTLRESAARESGKALVPAVKFSDYFNFTNYTANNPLPSNLVITGGGVAEVVGEGLDKRLKLSGPVGAEFRILLNKNTESLWINLLGTVVTGGNIVKMTIDNSEGVAVHEIRSSGFNISLLECYKAANTSTQSNSLPWYLRYVVAHPNQSISFERLIIQGVA